MNENSHAEGHGCFHEGNGVSGFIRSGECVQRFIFFQVFLEHGRAAFFQMINVIMGFKASGIQLDHGNGDVGAVVGYALEIGQQIVENEALKNGAVIVIY